ncbi:MAG TPA: hypothetical protein RMH99_17625 [Sandaracinaceae bacterium LLY-WYZ-13_1]|nr:hypothetical protein [Sandaracinaceae bacterium LLY-WYZ-13_1]
MRAPLLAAALAGCLAPSLAHADSVPSPPRGCPSGAVGRTGHAGTYCGPDRCQPGGDCPAADTFTPRPPGRRCEPAAFCVQTTVHRHPRGDTRVERFLGPCDADGTCEEGECERGHFCVDPDGGAEQAPGTAEATAGNETETGETETGETGETETGEAETGDGCQAAPVGSPAPAFAPGLALVVAACRRRRG